MKEKNEFHDLLDDFTEKDTEHDGHGETETGFGKILRKPAGYAIIALLVLEFVVLLVLLIAAGRAKISEEGSVGLRKILNSAGIGSVGNYEKLSANESGFNSAEKFLSEYLAEESKVISMLSPSFVSFVQHEYNVKNYAVHEESLLAPTEKPAEDGNGNPAENTLPSASTAVPGNETLPSETTSAATETPAAAPTTAEPQPPAQAESYKYYQFDLWTDGYSTMLYDGSGAVSAGILNDRSGGFDLTVSSKSDRDLVYGALTIQNPYKADGFDLREVLRTPLRVSATRDPDNPSVILYYTHTSEAYCRNAEEKLYANAKSIASYDPSRNIVGCGNLIEQALAAKNIGVLNCRDVNDESYDGAYGMSSALVNRVAGLNPSAELAIDVHSNSLEYPSGTRYGPKVEYDGQAYARILFVITVGNANPNWRENLKLAMLIIEMMEKRGPGVSMGISLRNDAKYNSVYTQKGLLIEIGFEGNLVSEANATAKLFGEVLGEIYG